MPREGRRYRLFGLTVDSAIDLPELPAQTRHDEKPDFTIAVGPVDAGRGFVLDIPDVARFGIVEGRSIVVEPAPGARAGDIRLFLLGSAMGALLHQRGLLPLHANAVALDGRAAAFMGRSGAGKSTLAAWFHDRGERILADDVCVIETGGEGALAFPGLPRLRLWEDALEASGRQAADHQLSFHLASDPRRKFDVPVRPDAHADRPLPLAALYLLEEGPELAITRMSGSAAVEALSANTYRGGLVATLGDSAAHVAACVAIARSVPMFLFRRPFDRGAFDGHCAAVLDHLRGLAPPSG